MPELPEVETVVRALNRSLLLKAKIMEVAVFWSKTIDEDASTFTQKLVGLNIVYCSRKGKWLILQLNNNSKLLIHLRMSGRLFLAKAAKPDYIRVRLLLDNGLSLFFYDPRKFGRIFLREDEHAILKNLGPDPTSSSWSHDQLRKALQCSRRTIKSLLLDQSVISGLGNIYADEVLWLSKIHPQRPGYKISVQESYILWEAIRSVLNAAIASNGTSLGEGLSNFHSPELHLGSYQQHLQAYGRNGLACNRCQNRMQKLALMQRGTTFCPNCQKTETESP